MLNGLAELSRIDFNEMSLEENREHWKKLIKVTTLMGWYKKDEGVPVVLHDAVDSGVEAGILKIVRKLRVTILKQMTLFGALYEQKSLTFCWKEFLFSNEGESDNWDGCDGFAEKAKNILFEAIKYKLDSRLQNKKNQLKSDKREEYVKMMWGLQARYNHSRPQYKEVELLLAKHDPNKEFERKWI